MNATHEAVILHTYHETAQFVIAITTGDGQQILVSPTICKCRCSCGEIFLQELPIVQPDEPWNWPEG